MTITDLISELQDALETYGDMEVMTSSNYGDYHRTEQLDEIAEIMPCVPVESAYSHSGLAYPDDQDREDRDEDEDHDNEYYQDIAQKPQVLVLRYQSR